MDHAAIEEEDVVGRYLRGELAAAEAEGFEQHLLACDACFEKVEWEGELRRSFGAWAVQQAAREAARAGLAGWLARRSTRRWALAGAALLGVALAVPGGILLQRQGELRKELAAARVRAAALAEELARPQINTPIIPLGALRDAGSAAATVILLPPEPGWIVLTVELPAVEFPSYRASLSAADGSELWRRDGLLPDPAAVLAVSVPSRSLEPGEYTLEVEGLTAAGAPAAAGVYGFRVLRSASPG